MIYLLMYGLMMLVGGFLLEKRGVEYSYLVGAMGLCIMGLSIIMIFIETILKIF